jgi:hypothetical protein
MHRNARRRHLRRLGTVAVLCVAACALGALGWAILATTIDAFGIGP